MKLFPCVASLFLAGFCIVHATTAPADLVVFPAQLPDVPNVFDEKYSPVIRWDKVPGARVEGLTLITAEKSPMKSPQAAMSYDMRSGGESVIIQVFDSADMMAPLTRMGQERLLSNPGASVPGATMSKVEIHPVGNKTAVIEGYLFKGPKTEPLLTMIIPNAKGEDRFVVKFSWLAANDNRAEPMAAWILKAAALINIAKLQSLP